MGDIQFKPKGWSIDQLARLVEHMPDLRVKMMKTTLTFRRSQSFMCHMNTLTQYPHKRGDL